MISSIIAWSVKRAPVALVLVCIALIWGAVSALFISVDAVPDITNNQVQIITSSPNLSSEDVEQYITRPIELSVNGVPHVEEVRSLSRFGLSVVTVVFPDDMGPWLPRQLLDEALQHVEGIPEGYGEPYIGPPASGLGEVYQYRLDVDESKVDLSLADLRRIQDNIVSRTLINVPGIVEVNTLGAAPVVFAVEVAPESLFAHDLTIQDVVHSLHEGGVNSGGAWVEHKRSALFIRGVGAYTNAEDIAATHIDATPYPLTVGEIATVKQDLAVRYGAFTQNGKGEAVGGILMMRRGENPAEVVQAVHDMIPTVQESLPEGVTIVPILDRSDLVERTLQTVLTNLVEGAGIVVLVLIFLLGNWRAGVVIAATVPISMAIAVGLMNVFGVTINLMSLGAIDFGILVDGAVIMVEAFLLWHAKQQRFGDRSIIESTSAVLKPAFFGQLIILLVFIPVMFLEGTEGRMFQPMAITFVFAMIGAVFACLLWVPAAIKVFRVKAGESKTIESVFETMSAGIQSGVTYLVRFKAIGIVAIAVLLVSGWWMFTQLGGQFLPRLEEGDLAIQVIAKPGTDLTSTVEITTRLEQQFLDNIPEITGVYSKIGVSEIPTDPMPMDIADVIIRLKPRSEFASGRTLESVRADIQNIADAYPGVNSEITQPIELRFNELLSGIRQDVAVVIYGSDTDTLRRVAADIAEVIMTNPAALDVTIEPSEEVPTLSYSFKRHALASYGVTAMDISDVIATAYGGAETGVVLQEDASIPIHVRMPRRSKNASGFDKLFVRTRDEQLIPVSEFVEITNAPQRMQISRENGKRRTYVGFNVGEGDLVNVIEFIKDRVNDVQMPTGYYVTYGGAYQNYQRATQSLSYTVPLIVLSIALLMWLALRNWSNTLLILCSVPVAGVGGVVGLYVRDIPFSVSAGIGFVVLCGLSVLNSLVLVSSFKASKATGTSIVAAVGKRVRPVLMTAGTDILGFLPMAISTSAGAEVQRPLATVVIFGLVTATVYTLLLLPSVYISLNTRKISKEIES